MKMKHLAVLATVAGALMSSLPADAITFTLGSQGSILGGTAVPQQALAAQAQRLIPRGGAFHLSPTSPPPSLAAQAQRIIPHGGAFHFSLPGQ